MTGMIAGWSVTFALLMLAGPAAAQEPGEPADGGEATTCGPALEPPAVVHDWSRDEFQFKFIFYNPLAQGGGKQSPESHVYLYIPVETTKVRALLLLQQNVIEQKVSVHPAIRRACDDNGIAIAWCTPGFDMNFDPGGEDLHELVQNQFGVFGASIGYPELGDVPLITFGHSNTTRYAQNAAESRPDRVLAVLTTHGGINMDGFRRYTGPVLVFKGQHSEWRQQGKSIVANKPLTMLSGVQDRLQRGWLPVSLVDEYNSGHFDYSEPIMAFFACFIDKAIKARLTPNGALRDLDPDRGYIADVPAVPTGPIPVRAYRDAEPEVRRIAPWYFDRQLAEAAATIIAGAGPWTRRAQLIGFNHPDGTRAVFTRGGLVSPVPCRIVPGTNRICFFPVLLDAMPPEFDEAGQSLAVSSDPTITMEYDCGAYIHLDEHGHYRVTINRSYPNGYGFIVARNLGDRDARPAVQPTRLVLWNGPADRPVEMIRPADQRPGAVLPLDVGTVGDQYKGYFVDHGPARVVDGKLHILPLPANTKGPVTVRLVAYLLGQRVTASSSATFQVYR